MRSETLDVRGWRDEPVANELVRADSPGDRLAILLPGYGYSREMPLFYYAEMILLDAGYDVLGLDYRYNQRPDYGQAPEDERLVRLFDNVRDDTSAALDAALALGRYRSVALVGKSLGTQAMAHLLDRHDAGIIDRTVWLTPLLSDEAVRRALAHRRHPSLIAIGTADSYYDESILDEIGSTGNVETVVVEGGDHSLDVLGDVRGTIRELGIVTGRLGRFLEARDATS